MTRIELHLRHAKEFINLGGQYDGDVSREFLMIAEIARTASSAVEDGNYQKPPVDHSFVDDRFSDETTDLRSLIPRSDTG